MTLEEAIKHAEEVVQEKQYEYQECLAVHDTEEAMNCEKCAEEHQQLAEWLKELRQLRVQTRWIPVTENLPDAGEDVLVTVNLGSVRAVGMDMYSLVEKDGFEGYGKDVVAWMSSPNPYDPKRNKKGTI